MVSIAIQVAAGLGSICGSSPTVTQKCTTSRITITPQVGENATFSAIPASGYRFDHFEIALGPTSTDNPWIVGPIVADGTVGVYFVAISPVTGTVTFHMDNARGTIVAAGVTKTGSTTGSYTLGQAQTIQGVAKSGYVFASWASTGGVSVTSPTQQTTTMTLSADGTLTANFNVVVVIYTPSITVSPTTILAGQRTLSPDLALTRRSQSPFTR